MRRSLPAVVLSVVAAAAVPASVARVAALDSAAHGAPAPVVRRVAPAPSPQVVRARALRHAVVHLAAQRRTTVGGLVGQWQRVALCEVNGNWHMVGPVYSGIGFLNATWARFGGLVYAPVAGRAGRFAQILVGMRVTHGWVPDQYGCQPGGW
jgi:Transglycosylase-like domain